MKALAKATTLLLLSAAALGYELRIKNTSDFITFSNNVNSGTSYAGTTVFLDTDINFLDDLSSSFSPIGRSTSRYFCGTFDGRGYTISNLTMMASIQFIGIFGYSGGATIRNIVVDRSCSLTNTYSSSSSPTYTGHIIGKCTAETGPCTVENIVNMADVLFTGSSSSECHMGGIAGMLYASDPNEATVKNCANYGSITHAGQSSTTYLAGIVGFFDGSSLNGHVQNCLNSGFIAHNGTSAQLYLGGILGIIYGYSDMDNCLSSGTIWSNQLKQTTNSIGSIAGYLRYTLVTHCFWTADVGEFEPYGDKSSTSTVTDSFLVQPNITTLSELNNRTSQNSTWNKWLYNPYGTGSTVSFSVNGGKTFFVSTALMLFPKPAESEGNTFSGWFSDDLCSVPLTGDITVVAKENTMLYSSYGVLHTITFVLGDNGMVASTQAENTRLRYPDPSQPQKVGYSFTQWSMSSAEVPDSNTTIEALFDPDNYTVSFNPNGGKTDTNNITVTFDNTYDKLPTATRTGYTFEGWFTEAEAGGGRKIEQNTIVNISDDHTLYAHWSPNTYTVLFNGNTGTPTKDSKSVTFDSTYGDLPTATKTGYTFTNWYTESTGGQKIESATTVTVANDHTLYAHWIINNYIVTFMNDSSVLVNTSLEYDAVISYPQNPTKPGYTFKDWSPKPNRVPANDVVIKATWTANVYTVTFNGNGGTLSQFSKEVVFDSPYGELPVATRSGYTFDGWYTQKEKGDKVDEKTTVGIPSEHTLYAQWAVNKYTVTFMNDIQVLKSETLEYNTPINYPQDPTKTGYSFIGWTPNPEKMPAYHVTITAMWSINSYKITFVNEDKVIKTDTLEYNTVISYPPAPTKTGYKFSGWSPNPERTPGSNTTIKATWEPSEIVVTFDGRGGTPSAPFKKVTFMGKYGDLPTAEQEGHSLANWFIKREAGEQLLTPNTQVETPEDHTAYARWTINSYTVTFDYGNGTTTKKVFQYNKTINYPENLTREGYTFNGWEPNPERMPGNDITVVAQWKLIPSSSSEKPAPSDKGSSNVGVIVGIVVSMFVFVIVGVLAILVFIYYKKKSIAAMNERRYLDLEKPLVLDKEPECSGSSSYDSGSSYSRVVTMEGYETTDEMPAGKALNSLYKVYPSDYVRPTMKEALLDADLPEGKVAKICKACKNAGKFAREDGKLFEGFTEEDAAAIAMYTYDFGAEEV